MITVNEIVAELAMSRRIRKQLARELKRMPQGTLFYKKEHGYYRPYLYRKGSKKYLGADKSELIGRLIRKKNIRESINAIDRNIAVLAHLESGFTDLENLVPEIVRIPGVGKSRSELRDGFDKWVRENAKAAKHGYMPRYGEQELITSDGVRVRSRVEFIIYEFLKSHNVDFVYEKPITIEGITFHPDFTIWRKNDGMIIFWEHFGMMDRDIYSAESRRKIYEYSKEGFWPYENLICTYDFGDGRIEIAQLEKILELMQLKPETSQN